MLFPVKYRNPVWVHIRLHSLCVCLSPPIAIYFSIFISILEHTHIHTLILTHSHTCIVSNTWHGPQCYRICHSRMTKVVRTFVCFPGSSDGKASAYNAGDRVRSLGWKDPLEKEMATHSSIHAWKIPWTEEPGGLQSMGSQRTGHNWATSLAL